MERKHRCALQALTVFLCCVPALESQAQKHTLTISNPLPIERTEEIAEVPLSGLDGGTSFVVRNANGNEVPCQTTHNGLLIFPVTLAGEASTQFTVEAGHPAATETAVFGRQYPERLDDMAWENDKAAYRAYGPALQRRGERSFGYDILCKSVDTLVLDYRYALMNSPEAWAKINAWRREGQKAKADSLEREISYHIDHGNGMDCYSVGATLGGGTAALLSLMGEIVYPYCYESYEVLDNGPLRFSVRLVFGATDYDGTQLRETRLISLDKGAYLNRTAISFEGLTATMPIVSGMVLHKENPKGYSLGKDYVAYADLTDNPSGNNGIIYVGNVYPEGFEATRAEIYYDKEREQHSGALGHALGFATIGPEAPYVYYWGSGWSKNGVESMEAWETYLKDFAACRRAPLQVTID